MARTAEISDSFVIAKLDIAAAEPFMNHKTLPILTQPTNPVMV